MNNSSNHNGSNDASNNNHFQVKDEEAELHSLLASIAEQTELTALQELLKDPKLYTDNLSQILPKDDFAQLRSLLLEPEITKLKELQERWDNPKLDAEKLSQLLPEAIILRSLRDQHLAKALVPTIEEAIRISVKKDLKILTNAFFPVIVPAIRKAIGTSLNAMTQSLEQTLKHSLSPQSFKWRLEAYQTGKSFAEVVLLRTLLYRVEQVFLIHKKTGLLLQNVVARAVVPQDAELVSAMLTAIHDFVKDSFSVKEGDSLETLHFGELTIWIEQGSQAMLAAVIRGNAPQEIRSFFQDAIESINLEQSNALEAFHGDTAPFEAVKPYLEECLLVQFEVKEKTKKSKKPKLIFKIALGAILVTFGPWIFFYIQSNQRWTAYLEKLNAERGIVVVAADKRHGKFFISGLRDPMAAEPRLLMKAAKLNPQQVISRWEYYLSNDAQFIEARANKLLQPPEGVSIKVDENGILWATGAASDQWIAQTRRLVKLIPGVREFRDNLIDIDPDASPKRLLDP